ncbi:heparin-binding EGF-like growth factor a [Austrofundulus limnaeus]|uniref:Proheparin-binding EGF-like growth factor n=1 Tax=Austrofundulus limnaeus TaxID=52670 RepID=A0A2I4B1G0_AUSLI|nr:PREDICTED: proheparin-binding EGF-like growth factor [Austrofundulus limnaeus]
MRIFTAVFLLLQVLAVSRLASGAAVDRPENKRHTSVFNLLETTRSQRRVKEDEESVSTPTATYSQEEEDEDYYDYEPDYEMSGDYDTHMPRVAMSSKPKNPSSILEAETTEGKKKRKRKGKGLGRKRNPCLKKYKDFCIHGTCQYLRDIRAPSCVCHPNYSGERCHLFTLPVQSPEGYSRTTALAVIAVVLSSVCLTIIGLLLMLRFYKRGAYDVESEEKVKLGLASTH